MRTGQGIVSGKGEIGALSGAVAVCGEGGGFLPLSEEVEKRKEPVGGLDQGPEGEEKKERTHGGQGGFYLLSTIRG